MTAADNPIPRIVRCPHCGKSAEYSPRNSFRPFCSERCRLIDLGDWAEGRLAIPVDTESLADAERELLAQTIDQTVDQTVEAPPDKAPDRPPNKTPNKPGDR